MLEASDEVHRDFNRIKKAVKADFPAATIVLAREFVAKHPHCGPAWKTLGDALAETGQYKKAEEAIRRAIALCPPEKLRIVLSQMGHSCRLRGDFLAAAAWYRKAIDVDPTDTCGHIHLGCVLAIAGRLHEALEAHRSASQCETGCFDEAWHNQGLVLRALGRYEEAIDAFEKAIEIDPDYEDAKHALADVRIAVALTTPSAPAPAEGLRRDPQDVRSASIS